MEGILQQVWVVGYECSPGPAVWRDPSGQVRLVQVFAHEDWVGRRFGEVEEAVRARIPFLTRFGQGMIPEPAGILQDGDVLYVAVTNDGVTRVESVLGAPPVRH